MLRTATVILVSAAFAIPASAADPAGRVLDAIGDKRLAAIGLDRKALTEACGEAALCVAERVAEADSRARLQAVVAPDTDSIRWVRNRASLGDVAPLPDGRVRIELRRFGRKLLREFDQAVAELAVGPAWSGGLVLDLRRQPGGDLGRMLDLAGRLTGAVEAALRLHDGEAAKPLSIPAPARRLTLRDLEVWVGPETASSAEILAALLRRHAGARVLGSRTAGKDYLYRPIRVDRAQLLLLPAERVEVAGEVIAGGLRPDAALPAQTAAAP